MPLKPDILNQRSEQYGLLARTSSPSLYTPVLHQLDQQIETLPTPLTALKKRALIRLKIGQLAQARADLLRLSDLSGAPSSLATDPQLIIPPDSQMDDNFEFPSLLAIDDFLPDEQFTRLLTHAQEQEGAYVPAGIGKEGIVTPSWRITNVLHAFTEGRDLFKTFIKENVECFTERLGLEPFPVGRREIKITQHMNAGHFAIHSDNPSPGVPGGREITWLYYFSTKPRAFSGGDLFLFASNTENGDYKFGQFIKITPKPNRFVAFPSKFFHTVFPVSMESDDFKLGRFAVSGHIRRHGTPPSDEDYV